MAAEDDVKKVFPNAVLKSSGIKLHRHTVYRFPGDSRENALGDATGDKRRAWAQAARNVANLKHEGKV